MLLLLLVLLDPLLMVQTRERSEVRIRSPRHGSVCELSLSGDGEYLAAVYCSRRFGREWGSIFHVPTGEKLIDLRDGLDLIEFSEDGRQCYSVRSSAQHKFAVVYCTDLPKRSMEAVWRTEGGVADCITLSNRGMLLAVAGSHGVGCLELKSMKFSVVAPLRSGRFVTCLAFSNDDRYLTAFDNEGGLTICDLVLSEGRFLDSIKVRDVVFDKPESLLGISTGAELALKRIDKDSGDAQALLLHEKIEHVRGGVLSADGSLAVVMHGPNRDCLVSIIDVRNGMIEEDLAINGQIGAVAISRDRSRLAVGFGNGDILVRECGSANH